MGEKPIVCKFGGAPLCDAARVRQAADIIRADSRRRYVVVSAPGKCVGGPKVTDLLLALHRHLQNGDGSDCEAMRQVQGRFRAMTRALGYHETFATEYIRVLYEFNLRSGEFQTADYCASLGEYLMAKILAQVLGFEFVDAAELIFFDSSGRLDNQRTSAAIQTRLASVERAVIPGFYGRAADGTIKTFSRGGSDITGALIAAALQAALCENWKDVDGVMAADPKIVPGARPVRELTYLELRELGYGGAEVFHPDAIPPLMRAGVRLHLRNSLRPDDPGTIVVPEADAAPSQTVVTGITGRRDYKVIDMTKLGMNEELGFGLRALQVLLKHGVSWEHMPTGADDLSLVIRSAELSGKEDALIADLNDACQPDALMVSELALVAVVGRRMRDVPGITGKVSGALGEQGINIRTINQGASQRSIIFGVARDQFVAAIKAAYQAFFA